MSYYLVSVLATSSFDSSLLFLLLFPLIQFLHFFQIKLRLQILAHPHITHLHNGPKLGSFEFVEVVVEVVGALDELGLVGLDGQLHLHHHLAPVEQVHEDVLVSLVEPVLDSDDFDA